MSDDRFRGTFEVAIDSYKVFFDHEAAGRLLDVTKDTQMSEPTFDLLVSWRALSNAHAMPFSMIEMLRAQWGGFHNRNTMTFAKNLAAKHRDAIVNNVELGKNQQKAVRDVMDGLTKEYARVSREWLHPPFPQGEIWNHLCEQDDFMLSIFGSQRSFFGSLYHHFEDFLRHTICVLKKDPEYRSRDVNTFKLDVQRYLGNKLDFICFDHEDMKFIRLVRNAISHSGGRMTQELAQLNEKYDFPMMQNRIQFMPKHTIWLHRELLWRVVSIVDTAIKKLDANPSA